MSNIFRWLSPKKVMTTMVTLITDMVTTTVMVTAMDMFTVTTTDTDMTTVMVMDMDTVTVIIITTAKDCPKKNAKSVKKLTNNTKKLIKRNTRNTSTLIRLRAAKTGSQPEPSGKKKIPNRLSKSMKIKSKCFMYSESNKIFHFNQKNILLLTYILT